MSYDDCIRISVSIRTPKAFSIRSAMSPDRSAWPLSRLERATRDTPSACAPAVTVSPSGSRISVRMKLPGCGGFCMRCSLAGVVVLIVHLDDLLILDAKGQAPVGRDVQAPHPAPIARQLMRPPAGQRAEFLGALHVLQERQHLAQLVHDGRRQATGLIPQIQAPQAGMGKRPNRHRSA